MKRDLATSHNSSRPSIDKKYQILEIAFVLKNKLIYHVKDRYRLYIPSAEQTSSEDNSPRPSAGKKYQVLGIAFILKNKLIYQKETIAVRRSLTMSSMPLSGTMVRQSCWQLLATSGGRGTIMPPRMGQRKTRVCKPILRAASCASRCAAEMQRKISRRRL